MQEIETIERLDGSFVVFGPRSTRGPIVKVRTVGGRVRHFEVRQAHVSAGGYVWLQGYPYKPTTGSTSGVHMSHIATYRILDTYEARKAQP